MRNGKSVLWWMLGIYLIFSVTSGALAQAVPSETDTASDDSEVHTISDDSALSQVQMMKIMDEIHELEIRLRAHIDQRYSEGKEESATLQEIENEIRAHIDQRYSELNTEISAIGEIRLRDHINTKHSEHNEKIEELSKDVEELTTKANSLQIWLRVVFGLELTILGIIIGIILPPIFFWWWRNSKILKRVARFFEQLKPPGAST